MRRKKCKHYKGVRGRIVGLGPYSMYVTEFGMEGWNFHLEEAFPLLTQCIRHKLCLCTELSAHVTYLRSISLRYWSIIFQIEDVILGVV